MSVRIQFANSMWAGYASWLDDDSLLAILVQRDDRGSGRLSCMTALSLAGCEALTGFSLAAIGSYCCGLVSLNLDRCSNILKLVESTGGHLVRCPWLRCAVLCAARA